MAMLAILLPSCIKSFEPVIESRDAVKLVVTGQVNKGDRVQHINISNTSALSQPMYKYYLPVTGCIVMIVDNTGDCYAAADLLNGNYEAFIPEEKLAVGASFKVVITTPEGDSIVSDYDQIHECPEVDSVYFVLEQIPSTDPVVPAIRGIRFYFDLDAQNSSTRYFRWEATETWEYKAILAKQTELKVCWMTGMVKDIFTLSTQNLVENKYKLYPLHFVDNFSSQRLKYGYSLLLRQYALSGDAFVYWDKVRKNNSEQGGLYETQPLQIKGNLHNLSHPEKQVLGFFGASSATSKRIFVSDVKDLPSQYLDCEPDPRPEAQCVDCLSVGGTNIKPAFWPN
jgi:hypothetical protein